MSKLFLVISLLLTVMIGCGGDDDSECCGEPPSIIHVTPPGGDIYSNTSITVIFDNPPAEVSVSTGVVEIKGKTATITGPFTPGPLALTITWPDGTQLLRYNVAPSDCCASPITGGTVMDGDKDVDPEALNRDGKIEIEFAENVTGQVALQTEAGEDVGWIGKVVGNKAILELVEGRELKGETTYVIAGKVFDADGNSLDVSVTFVTRIKER